MDKYVEAEFRLAALLGWKIKSMYDVATGWHDPAGKYQPNLPQWCRDNAAAFALMVEHECYPSRDNPSDEGIAAADDHGWGTFEYWKDHPDRDTAVRYCVVMAVIAKLEANNV